MRLSPIVVRLRATTTRFGNRIAGSAELETAMNGTLMGECAFVVPLGEFADPSKYSGGINQKITERFGVIVALQNDTTAKDKLGLTAYDLLDSVRAQIFKAILGWEMPGTETPISYGGARLITLNRGYLWYQYEFVFDTRVGDADGIDTGADSLDNFDEIYAQWEMTPSVNIPVSVLPLPVTHFTPDMTTDTDLTVDLLAGGFSKGFSAGFDVYKG